MDEYGLLLFLHVLGAVLWAGGVAIYYVLIERMNSVQDRTSLRGLLEHLEKIGFAYFMPVSITTLLAGIFLVIRGEWDWSEPFVMVGLIGIVITIVVGAVLSTPREKALMEALNRPEATDAEVRQAFSAVRVIARVDLGLLLIVIFFMTVKPGT